MKSEISESVYKEEKSVGKPGRPKRIGSRRQAFIHHIYVPLITTCLPDSPEEF